MSSSPGPPVLGLGADRIEALLRHEGGLPHDTSSDSLLALARDHYLVPTLLSAWERDGERLSEDLAEILEHHRTKESQYLRLLSDLQRVALVCPFKGARIGKLYHPGLVRHTNDIDLLTTCEEQLWSASCLLDRVGWSYANLSVIAVGDVLHIMVRLRGPRIVVAGLVPDYVQISTLAFWGNGLNVPPTPLHSAGVCPSSALDLAMIVAERVERPYALRDTIDAALLADSMASADRSLLERIVDELDLWPEWGELHRRVEESGLLSQNTLLRVSQGRVTMTRRRRFARTARLALAPREAAVRYVQSRITTGRSNGVLDLVRTRWDALMSARIALERGLPLFGIHVGDTRASNLTLDSDGSLLFATSPAGTFLLVAGDILSDVLECARLRHSRHPRIP